MAGKLLIHAATQQWKRTSYWHRVLGFTARKTPRWVKILLKRNMTKTLGTVLDYKGVAFEEALLQLKIAGVAFSAEEMNELRAFLLRFHSCLEKN